MAIRIVLADDHTVFRNGLKALLEKEEDFSVVGEAGSGIEVLHLLDQHDTDVLLFDLRMAGVPGTTIAQTSLEKKPDLAVVVLTTHEDRPYMRQLFQLGVRAFLSKRATGRELSEAIRAVHRGEQYVDASLVGGVFSDGTQRRSGKRRVGAGLLTAREREVCGLLACGHTNTEISKKLFISERTVETHRFHIMHKLNLHTRAELVRFSIENGLLKLT